MRSIDHLFTIPDGAGAVAVHNAAVARVAPNDAAEIAVKRTARKVIAEIADVVAAGNPGASAAVLTHNAAKIAAGFTSHWDADAAVVALEERLRGHLDVYHGRDVRALR